MTEQQEDTMIAKAFNAGYLMQQHEPELLNSILKSNNQDNQYIKAMATGKEEQQKEQKRAQEKLIKKQQEIREKQKTKKRGR